MENPLKLCFRVLLDNVLENLTLRSDASNSQQIIGLALDQHFIRSLSEVPIPPRSDRLVDAAALP